MPGLNSLQDLMVEELKDIYNAEQQLLEAIPKLAKAVTTPSLERALTHHREQTEQQVERLQQIFDTLGERPTGKKCKGMEGIVREGSEALDGGADSAVRDAHIIGAAQRVEHYEIAAYGTAIAHAELLGHDDVARLLRESLDEEMEADRKLTEIAEDEVNMAAASNGATAETPRSRR